MRKSSFQREELRGEREGIPGSGGGGCMEEVWLRPGQPALWIPGCAQGHSQANPLHDSLLYSAPGQVLAMFSKKKKRLEISAPSNFEHRVHTGYDQHEQKFTGLPRQWQGLIEESAKRPKPLVDPVCITTIQHASQKVGSSLAPAPGLFGKAAAGAGRPKWGSV